MLRLSEIRMVKETVDDDWRSPVADAVAAAWGVAPGVARWWRSSATHVFVVPGATGATGAMGAAGAAGAAGATRRYLRFVPAGSSAASRLRAGVELAQRVPRSSRFALAQPVRTVGQTLIANADTVLGPMAAALFDEAVGDEVDADELDPPLARRWGAALATLHTAAPAGAETRAHPARPTAAPAAAGAAGAPETARHGERSASADPDLAAAIERLDAVLTATIGERPRTVTMHGDFELDNLRFTDDGVIAFDTDETRAGSPAEDIALATRALRGEEDEPARPDLYAAFLDGYRSIAELSPAEEAAIALYGLRYSVRRAAGTSATCETSAHPDASALDEGGDAADPDWQRDLYDDLRSAQAWHRRAVIEGVAALPMR